MNYMKGSSPGVPSWDDRYSQEEYVYGEEANLFLQKYSHLIPTSSHVAAFAEGEGRNAVFLAKQGHRVTAYDYSMIGLLKAKALATKHYVQIETIQQDLIESSLPAARYDAAVMIFGHFPQAYQYEVLNSILYSLKPGGQLLMELYEEEQINYGTGGPKERDWLYNSADLLKWARQEKVLHFYTGEVIRTEGLYHQGKSYVVQLALTKA